MCEATKRDIKRMIASPHPTPKDKAMARRCGLHFGGDVLGRILLGKFKTQVEFIEKCLRKSQGQQLPSVMSRPPVPESTSSNTLTEFEGINPGYSIQDARSISPEGNNLRHTTLVNNPSSFQAIDHRQDLALPRQAASLGVNNCEENEAQALKYLSQQFGTSMKL